MSQLSNWEIMIMLIFILLVIVVISAVLCRSQNVYRTWCINLCNNMFRQAANGRIDASTPIFSKSRQASVREAGSRKPSTDYDAINESSSPKTDRRHIPVIVSRCSVDESRTPNSTDDVRKPPVGAVDMALLEPPDLQRSASFVSLRSIEGEYDVACVKKLDCRLKRTHSAMSVDPHSSLVPMTPEPLPNGVNAMLELSLCYDAGRGYLNIGIAYAYCLRHDDLKTFSDCYVRLIVSPKLANAAGSPQRSQYRTTKVVKTSEVVEILQKFRFDLPKSDTAPFSSGEQTRSELAKVTLELNAYGRARQHTTVARRDMIIDTQLLANAEPRVAMFNLYAPTVSEIFEPLSIGEILVSMCYQPTANKLTLILLQLKETNFSPSSSSERRGRGDELRGLSGSVCLVLDGKVSSRKKLKEVRVYDHHVEKLDVNQVVFFQLDKDAVQEAEIRVMLETVREDGRRNLDGFFYIGNSSSGNGLLHWKCIMGNPRKPYVLWHPIVKYDKTGDSGYYRAVCSPQQVGSPASKLAAAEFQQQQQQQLLESEQIDEQSPLVSRSKTSVRSGSGASKQTPSEMIEERRRSITTISQIKKFTTANNV